MFYREALFGKLSLVSKNYCDIPAVATKDKELVKVMYFFLM